MYMGDIKVKSYRGCPAGFYTRDIKRNLSSILPGPPTYTCAPLAQPKAPPPAPAPQITVSPVIQASPQFQQAFRGQVSPIVSPIIGSRGAQTGGAPTQAGNGGQRAGLSQTGLDAQLKRERELAAREMVLVRQAAEQKAMLLAAEHRATLQAQLREREAQRPTQQPAPQQPAPTPQFIPGAQIIEQAAPALVTEKATPPPSKMPGWVVPVMIVTATGAVILLTRKRKPAAKRSRR